MKVKNQKIEDRYAIYNGDCMDVVTQLESNSIDLSVYSPPFAGLYNYSSSEKDFSNCDSKEQFLEQYEFLIKEMGRITKPGRINAVHCQDVLTNVTTNVLWDFPAEIIKLHEKHGFTYNNRITVWKEPLKVRMRTMVQSLMHKYIVEDSTKCFTAMPDYVLIFKKKGENKVPVEHKNGLDYYAGEYPLTIEHLKAMGLNENIANGGDMTKSIKAYIFKSFNNLRKKFANHSDHKSNKYAHIIWQRYASAVWDDIRNENVLQFKDAREDDDEKHVHPLQLDVIDRIVQLYSNRDDVVLTPFMGVGSEVYSPLSLGRKAIGIELKDSYFKQALKNIAEADKRFEVQKTQTSIFDL
jgi:DNA modification methylase